MKVFSHFVTLKKRSVLDHQKYVVYYILTNFESLSLIFGLLIITLFKSILFKKKLSEYKLFFEDVNLIN